jgi:hypothetical protein
MMGMIVTREMINFPGYFFGYALWGLLLTPWAILLAIIIFERVKSWVPSSTSKV